jgi:hypothetical protein
LHRLESILGHGLTWSLAGIAGRELCRLPQLLAMPEGQRAGLWKVPRRVMLDENAAIGG